MSEQTHALVPVLEPVFVEVMDNRPKLIEISQGQVNPVKLWTAFEISTHQMPKLRECANTIEGRASVISGLIKCADLGLTPNHLNLAWMIPFVEHLEACKKAFYKNCKCPKVLAQFMPGYKGYQQCASQSDALIYKYRSQAVYKEERERQLFAFIANGEDVRHEPCLDDDFEPRDENLILVYTKIYRSDGTFFLHFTRQQDILKTMRRTKSVKHLGKTATKEQQASMFCFKNEWGDWKEVVGAWRTDFLPMALKTDIKAMSVRHMQLTPLSKIGRAVSYDEEGVENPMRLNFNGTMPELPATLPRVERMVQRERAKSVITPKTELRGAPMPAPDAEIEEHPASPDEANAAESSADAESHDTAAEASPAKTPKPASGAGTESSFLDWQDIAYRLGKDKLFDARFKSLLAEQRVKSMDELAEPNRKKVVAALGAIVRKWVAEKESQK